MSVKKIILGVTILVACIGMASFFFFPSKSKPPARDSLTDRAVNSAQSSPQKKPESEEQQKDGRQKKASSKAETNTILVSVVEAYAETQQIMVSGLGEVVARWATELTAEVSGRVDYVSSKLLEGNSFKEGDVLAQINSIDYESARAAAKADVAAAQVIYLEQQRETEQAKERWELSGLPGTPSDLTLQTPQLAQALSSLESAKAALAKAEKDLARTKIVAPFNGRVRSRSIDIGGYAMPGTTLAEVFATDTVEINIALTEQQFALLGDEEEAINRTVTLTDTSNGSYFNNNAQSNVVSTETTDSANENTKQWIAKIARFQYHIDSTQRTRNVVLEVSRVHAAEDLMPGTFVKALIPGKIADNLIRVPASALSRDGYIWHVENETLQRFKASIIYRNDDYIIVKKQNTENELQVVRYPQSAFLPGQAVKAKKITASAIQSSDNKTNSQSESKQKVGADK